MEFYTKAFSLLPEEKSHALQTIVDSTTEETTQEELIQALDALEGEGVEQTKAALSCGECNGAYHPTWYAERIRAEEAEFEATTAAIKALNRYKDPLLDLLLVSSEKVNTEDRRVENAFGYMTKRWLAEPGYRREYVGKHIQVADILRHLDYFLTTRRTLLGEASVFWKITRQNPLAFASLKAEYHSEHGVSGPEKAWHGMPWSAAAP